MAEKNFSIKMMRLEPPLWRAISIPHLDPFNAIAIVLVFYSTASKAI